MQANGKSREPPNELPDAALWRRSRLTDCVDDEAERYLDLAGFADGRLDTDDRERVTEWLVRSPAAAADIVAARSLVEAEEPPDVPEAIIARACTLVPRDIAEPDNLIRVPHWRWRRPDLNLMARWGSLAAAVVMASWLGFTLGMDTSRSFAQLGNGDEGLLHDMLDPPSGFLRDLTEAQS